MTRAHILIVDHKPAVLKPLDEVLAKADYEVYSCIDVYSAQLSLSGNKFDLLVTDIPMPSSLDDVDLIAVMRKEKPDLPVLILSEDLNGLANSNGIRAPIAFLVKPFDAQEVLDTVEMLLSGSANIIHSRAASADRDIDARPIGTPTDDRHAMETAHTWEDEKQPGTLPDQLASEDIKPDRVDTNNR